MADPLVPLATRVPHEAVTLIAALAAEISARETTPTTAAAVARMAVEAGLPIVAERVRTKNLRGGK